MASATPDIQLPPQPQSVIALWPVTNYPTAWQTKASVCEQLAQGCYLALTVHLANTSKTRYSYTTTPHIGRPQNKLCTSMK